MPSELVTKRCILLVVIVLVCIGLFKIGTCFHSLSSRPSPIFAFVEQSQLDSVRLALDDGTPVDVRYPDSYSIHGGFWQYQGETPLFYAAATGNLPIAKLLIERGADVNARSALDNTALMEAAHHNQTILVKYLLDAGAKADDRNNNGATPLLASLGRHSYHSFLYAGGAKTLDDTCIAAMLLAHGAKVTEQSTSSDFFSSDYGFTPLILASIGGRPRTAQFLLDHGAEIEARSAHGFTPILAAASAMQGHSRYDSLSPLHLGLVETFLKRGADLSASTKSRINLLMFAARAGALKLSKSLIQYHGLDPRARDEDSLNTLHFACMSNNLELVTYLVDSLHMMVNPPGGKRSVLHCAVGWGDVAIVRYLIARGANVNALDSEGRNIFYGCFDDSVKALLVSAGALSIPTLSDQ